MATRIFRQIIKKIQKYSFFILVSLIFLSAFVVVVAKAVFTDNTYVYAKIKVSQGLWWANTARPSLWIANSIKKGDKEQGLGGNPLVEVQTVRYYPISSQNAIYQEPQYDVYLTVKMKVQYNKNTDSYSFKRELLR